MGSTNSRLTRSMSNKMIGGVCSGLAHKLGLDPTLVRLGVAGITLFTGLPLAVYLVMWAVIPADNTM